jgi:hypothetical protein
VAGDRRKDGDFRQIGPKGMAKPRFLNFATRRSAFLSRILRQSKDSSEGCRLGLARLKRETVKQSIVP